MTWRGTGQDLSSPGSCLEKFVAVPFVECSSSRSRCRRHSSDRGFWLAAVDANQMVSTVSSGSTQRVSRCRVCYRQ